MKIVYVVSEYPGFTSNYGGIAVVVKNEVEYFLSKQYSVEVLLVANKKATESEAPYYLKYFQWPKRGLMKGLRLRWNLVCELNRNLEKTDIVVTHDYSGLIPWFIKPVKVVQLHESLTLKALKQKNKVSILTYILEYLTLMTSDKIRAVSKSVLIDTLKEFPFLTKKRSAVVYNGVKREKQGGNPQYATEPKVIFIGKLSLLKGADFLSEIINNVHLVIPDAKFTIIGHDEFIDGVSRRLTVLSKIIRKVQVDFVERVDNSEVARYMLKSKLLILPSRTEALPMVVLEAFSNSLPVVSFNVGGLNEMIADCREGFLIPRFDVQLFSERVIEILGSDNLRSEMARYARIRFEENFELDKICSELERFYIS
jgi:glycosyltransferase involved in cell wall biosynthesis